MYDITPFPPMVLKVNYNKFDWPKVKEFCEKYNYTIHSRIIKKPKKIENTIQQNDM